MGEEKIKRWKRDCNVCKLGDNAEVNKSRHPYLKPDLAQHCDVLFIVESVLLALLSLN